MSEPELDGHWTALAASHETYFAFNEGRLDVANDPRYRTLVEAYLAANPSVERAMPRVAPAAPEATVINLDDVAGADSWPYRARFMSARGFPMFGAMSTDREHALSVAQRHLGDARTADPADPSRIVRVVVERNMLDGRWLAVDELRLSPSGRPEHSDRVAERATPQRGVS